MNYQDNNSQPSGGRFIRLFIGIAIALFGLFMYMTQEEENPLTKEKQHISITPSEEIKLGLDSAPKMAAQMGGEVSDNDPKTIEVKKMGNHLVDHTLAKNSPWKFQFHLLGDAQTINAFALPGGQIFITLGLYNKLENEAQLAGVLAHEMGHVIERHAAQQMATSQLGEYLTIAVGTAASDQGSSAYQIAAVVNQAVQMKYSRGDELQADLWGLKLMTTSGYDPNAMVKVMNILKTAGPKGNTPEFFQTHPNPDLRIKQIQDYLGKNPPPAGLSDGNPLNKH
jgi:predicted Zn-dependent protease